MEAGGLNLYGFVGNNSVNNWDAYGRFGVPGAVIGGAAGAVWGGWNGYRQGGWKGAFWGGVAGGVGGEAWVGSLVTLLLVAQSQEALNNSYLS
jgi:hypothetical protein